MPLFMVVPAEELLVVNASILDRAEALGEVGSVLQGLELRFEYGLSSEACGQLWVRATSRLISSARPVWIACCCRDRHAASSQGPEGDVFLILRVSVELLGEPPEL
jgi:hypothetical protein